MCVLSKILFEQLPLIFSRLGLEAAARRSASMSRRGRSPDIRAYSGLNCDLLSGPFSRARVP